MVAGSGLDDGALHFALAPGLHPLAPFDQDRGSTREDAGRLRDALLYEDRIEVQLHPWRGRLWARISGQIYNEIGDVERLADAVTARM